MNLLNLLGIALAALGAAGFAISAQLQHRSVNQAASQTGDKPGHLAKIMSWLRQPQWLAGFAVMLVSIGLHLTAVVVAPVSLVQPIGVLSVPFSLIITRWVTGEKPRKRVQTGVVLTVGGTAAFALLAAHYVGSDNWMISGRDAAISQIVVWGIALVFMLLGECGPGDWRALSWGAAAGVLYGLSTANMKHLVMLLQSATVDWVGAAMVFVMVAVAYATGLWCVQHGYGLAEPAVLVACLTVLDPVVAVAFGFLILGEASTIPNPVLWSMASAGALAILGVLLTSWTGRIKQPSSQ